MKYYSMEDFFIQHLKRKNITIKDAKFQTLVEDTNIGNYKYAKGSVFKVFETLNFGWIVFRQDTKTPNGNNPFRLIIKLK